MEASVWREYDEWLADHMEELIGQYPSKVVVIHQGQVVYTGDSEVEVYQWVARRGLTPMPLIFCIPRVENSTRSYKALEGECQCTSCATSLPRDGWRRSITRGSGCRMPGIRLGRTSTRGLLIGCCMPTWRKRYFECAAHWHTTSGTYPQWIRLRG